MSMITLRVLNADIVIHLGISTQAKLVDPRQNNRHYSYSVQRIDYTSFNICINLTLMSTKNKASVDVAIFVTVPRTQDGNKRDIHCTLHGYLYDAYSFLYIQQQSLTCIMNYY